MCGLSRTVVKKKDWSIASSFNLKKYVADPFLLRLHYWLNMHCLVAPSAGEHRVLRLIEVSRFQMTQQKP